MSMYYALACNKCRTKVDFVTTACAYSLMGDETQPRIISMWFGKHVGHKSNISILSEHEPNYDLFVDDDAMQGQH